MRPAIFGVIAALTIAILACGPARAESLRLEKTPMTEWKSVFGRIEARDTVPARARIGGIVVELLVSEGDRVTEGQKIAAVRDEKIAIEMDALDAQLRSYQSQFETANADLERAKALVEKGVMTVQRRDQLQTLVDVARNQIAATEAQRKVLEQRTIEGEVLAPADGRILDVPVTRGAVILVGEQVATVGSGGFFLRLSIPERHALSLNEGASMNISAGSQAYEGKLVKIYPRIENGRVICDVEVSSIETRFVDARVLVEVPVGERDALLIPESAVSTRFGVDFVTVELPEGNVERAVVIGNRTTAGAVEMVEILTGLSAGDTIVLP